MPKDCSEPDRHEKASAVSGIAHVKALCYAVRPRRLASLLAIAALLVAVALVTITLRRAGLTSQDKRAAAALLDLQARWATNGNNTVFSRSRWPPSIKALGMNGVEVGSTLAGASKRADGPLGFWWRRGYLIQRQRPNDDRWTLYRTRALGFPHMKGWAWRSILTVVTNTP